MFLIYLLLSTSIVPFSATAPFTGSPARAFHFISASTFICHRTRANPSPLELVPFTLWQGLTYSKTKTRVHSLTFLDLCWPYRALSFPLPNTSHCTHYSCDRDSMPKCFSTPNSSHHPPHAILHIHRVCPAAPHVTWTAFMTFSLSLSYRQSFLPSTCFQLLHVCLS